MKSDRSRRSIAFRIVRGVLIALVLLGGLFFFDHLPSLWNDVTPPSNLTTIEEFRSWKGDRIRDEGIFENEGMKYTVLTGDFAAFLASGPTAYVFDSEGAFVDWTRDMGDIRTTNHGFDLTSGNVNFGTNEEP
jgi:hypothetical protein